MKVQLGLCKGKKLYDKRQDMAKRAAKREIDRAMKEKNRWVKEQIQNGGVKVSTVYCAAL